MRTVSQRSIRLLGGSAVVLVDSITQVVPEDAGKIVISGSHGGTSAAFFAAQVPALLYAFNDAGEPVYNVVGELVCTQPIP